MRRPLWLPALLLASHARASLGPRGHAEAANRALKRAREFLESCQAVDAAQLGAGRSPLEAESDGRPVFQQYLLALRHMMAMATGAETSKKSQVGKFLSSLSAMLVSRADVDAFLARAGELDLELSGLVSAGRGKPYFFWHGPKRHVPQNIDELMGLRIDGAEVREYLANATSVAVAEPAVGLTAPSSGLGLAYPREAHAVDMAGDAWVLVASGDVCSASDVAAKAGVRNVIVGGSARLEKCLPKQGVVWDVSGLWSSYFSGQSQRPLQDMLNDGLGRLGRANVDVLALPPLAWLDARLQEYCLASVAGMTEESQVGRVALAGAVSAEELRVILDSELAPGLWLVPHDDCLPVEPRLLEMAHKAGVRVVGSGTPCKSAGLELAMAGERLSEAILLSRWTAELGMGVAFAFTGAEDISRMVKNVQAAEPLSARSWALLAASYPLARPLPSAAQDDSEDAFAVRAALRRASKLAGGQLQGRERPRSAPSALSEEVWRELLEDQRKFYDNNYFIYRRNLLSPEVYEALRREAERLWRSSDIEPNCNLDGADRSGGYIIDSTPSRHSSLYQLIYGSEDFRQWVSRINGHAMFPSDFPMELREYPPGSKGMPCHRDLLMYTNATLDLEFVYTIDNLGTCVSTFDDRRGETHEVHTEPNSLFMLRPNAAMHCVRPSEGGHRTILKFIYVGDYRKSAEFDYYAENKCGADNPNVQLVMSRRRGHGAHESEL